MVNPQSVNAFPNPIILVPLSGRIICYYSEKGHELHRG